MRRCNIQKKKNLPTMIVGLPQHLAIDTIIGESRHWKVPWESDEVMTLCH